MAIRMIVTDMDGTLLDAKNGISEKNRAALKEAAAKDVHVAIATGRMHLSALPYAKEIGVTAPIVSSRRRRARSFSLRPSRPTWCEKSSTA